MDKNQLLCKIESTNLSELSFSKLQRIVTIIIEQEDKDKPTCSKCGYDRLADFSASGYIFCTNCHNKTMVKKDERTKQTIQHQR